MWHGPHSSTANFTKYLCRRFSGRKENNMAIDIYEKYDFTGRIKKIRDGITPRLKKNRIREATETGYPDDGKQPFIDAFKNNPDEPYIICYAKGIVDSWLVSEPHIFEGDYFVGFPRNERAIKEHFSWGLCIDWDMMTTEIEPEILERMQPIEPDTKNIYGRELMGAEVFDYAEGKGGLWWTGGYQGHTIPGNAKLVRLGIKGILDEINEHDALTHPNDKKRKDFYAACRIIMEGLSEYCLLYARYAEELAETAEGEWKCQLLEIAKNCRAVSMDAPTTLYEACQLLWFYTLWDWADCIGRVDRFLYPFYKEAGENRDDLIAALILKYFEHGAHNITVGGVDPVTGEDSTNEISYQILKVLRTNHDTHPRVAVRIHEGTPQEMLDLIVLMWSEGLSDPSIVSDKTVIEGLVSYGVPLHDARDYATLGCQEIEIPGKSNFGCEDGSMNLAKVLEYTLNHGRDRRRDDLQMAPDVGGTEDYKTFDELWNAFVFTTRYLTRLFVDLCNVGAMVRDKNVSKLVKSCTTDCSISRGINMDGGGALYNYGCVETGGHGAVGDSLYAMKKLVYDEGKLTLQELEAALAADFEGYEDIRRMLLSVPKYGNNDEGADEMAARVLDMYWTEIGKYNSYRGQPFTGACSLLEAGIEYGSRTWALPDGRHTGEALGNTIGPRTGSDKNGLTAMLSSVAKMPLRKGVGGTTCNVLIPTDMTKTPELRANIAALMKTFCLMGGQLAQITTASLEDMKDAQIHPEAHEDLIVRVGGFSMKFIEFGKEAQDEFIKRYGD